MPAVLCSGGGCCWRFIFGQPYARSARDLLLSDNNSRRKHSSYFNIFQTKTSTAKILQTTRDTHFEGLNILGSRTRDRVFQTKPIKEPRSAAYWLLEQGTDGPGVRMAETTEGGGDGSLFQGKQFWLSQNIPQRSRFKELIAVYLICHCSSVIPHEANLVLATWWHR